MRENQKWKKMGFQNEEVLGVIRETAEKHFHKDFGQLMAAVKAQENLENIKTEVKEQEDNLKTLREEVRGNEELRHILGPLMKQGNTGEEKRLVIGDALLVADRSGSLHGARKDFRSMLNIKSLRGEGERLKGVTRILRDEESRIKSTIDNGLAQIDTSVARAVRAVGEATHDLNARSVAADPVQHDKMVPLVTHLKPQLDEEGLEVIPSEFGIVSFKPLNKPVKPLPAYFDEQLLNFTCVELRQLLDRKLMRKEDFADAVWLKSKRRNDSRFETA